MKRYFVPCFVCILMLDAQAGFPQDHVGLSFSNVEIVTADTVEMGNSVTIHLVAFLADRTEGITGFSCRVDWNQDVIKEFAWQTPVETGGDGSVFATFPQALYPVDGCIVLATAIGQTAASDSATVWMVGTPYIVGTVNRNRDVPLGGRPGRRLCLGYSDPDDLGPPGQPGVPSYTN
jgi:hypothetical protein